MRKNDIYFFHFYVRINNSEYALSTLKIDLKNNQIFYVFNHPKGDSEIDTILFDHISYHPNKTHLKINTNKILAETKTSCLPLEGEAKIILFMSFFLSSDGLHLLKENINFSPKWKEPKFNQEILIADLMEPIDFSLMLVLVPCDSKNDLGFIETCAIIDKNGNKIKLPSIKHLSFKIGLIKNAFPNHNILVFPSPYLHDRSRWNEGSFWKIFHPEFAKLKM